MSRALVVLLVLGGGTAAAAPGASYRVTVPPELGTLAVEACFEAAPPRRLAPADGGDTQWLQSASGEGGLVVRRDAGGLRLDGERGCVRYVLDLAGAARAGSRVTVPGVRLLPAGRWLWTGDEREVNVRFALPPGVNVSVPWQPDGEGGWRPVTRTLHWRSLTAFGRFPTRSLSVGGARLELAVLGPVAGRADEMADWLEEAANAVARVHGRYPVPYAQLIAVSGDWGGEPVPWAQVWRGGGPGVHFFVDASASLAAFREDWTAPHELSHLLLPFVTRRDAWFSEGLASYYQNVSRARAGLLSPEAAWQKLHEGFDRGRAATDGRSLDELMRSRSRDGSVMRVYWSGAAMWLLADLAWRERGSSLDAALGALSRCCLPGDRAWTAGELAAKLDELAGAPVLAPLVRHWRQADGFPDLGPAWARLGIDASGPRLAYRGGAQEAARRRAIMAPPSPPSGASP